jgi:hypothetical protein
MAFTAVVGDIPVQPGIDPYNFYASGTITKGQAVYLSPGMEGKYVAATTASSQRLFGIAAYTQYHNSSIAIYGPCNLVKCKLSGSQSAGTLVGSYLDGMISNISKYPNEAIVTKGVTSSGDGEILILGRSA